MIPKEIFVNVMNSLMVQMHRDRQTEDLLKEAYGEFHLTPDNSLLISSIIELLAINFNKDEIVHYIFNCNFGKLNSESEHLTPNEFYDQLIKLNKNGRK
jgi:hypothetical protein